MNNNLRLTSEPDSYAKFSFYQPCNAGSIITLGVVHLMTQQLQHDFGRIMHLRYSPCPSFSFSHGLTSSHSAVMQQQQIPRIICDFPPYSLIADYVRPPLFKDEEELRLRHLVAVGLSRSTPDIAISVLTVFWSCDFCGGLGLGIASDGPST